MELAESPLINDEAMAVLNSGYLLRPTTRAELRACLDVVPDRFDDTVDALVAAGLIRSSEGRLFFESPYLAFAALGRARAERIQDEAIRTASLMQAMPDLIRAWDVSQTESAGMRPFTGTVIHTDPSTWAEWFEHLDGAAVWRPSMVVVDPDFLTVALAAGHLGRLQRRAAGSSVRLLLPHRDWPSQVVTLLDDAVAQGILVRASASARSWLYVDEGHQVGLPVLWGAPSPTSVLAIHTQPVVAGMAMLFDELWARAAGWEDEVDPIMQLLSQGATDEAIARTLGLAVRTVRRRIADSMEEYGASSRFMLGAAWAGRVGVR